MTILTEPLWSDQLKMKACVYQGPETLYVDPSHPRPIVSEPKDAIVRITTTTICGSDLHLYHGVFPFTNRGDIFGHEGVGFVEAIGSEVKNVAIGDKVVISAVIADGVCQYCQKEQFSLCAGTNPSEEMKEMYGHGTSGIFGYSHLTGGYPGTHAEYVRVPFADVNLLKINNLQLSDEKAVLLSDVACTAWHANELGEVSPGDSVVIWGAGPIGLMSAVWAKYCGAASVTIIDCVESRLKTAAKETDCKTLNFSNCDIKSAVLQLYPLGPDVAIDAVGFRYAKSWKHYIERKAHLETDAIDSLTEAILCVKKGGRLVLIGDYIGYANHYPIGPMMEKSLTVRGGQVFVQKYWKKLAEIFASGKVDPSFLFTHKTNLDGLPQAFALFDGKQENCLKVLVKV